MSSTTANTIVEVPVTDLIETKVSKQKQKQKEKTENKGPSKSQIARDLVQQNFNNVATGNALSRSQVIKQIMQTCNMGEAGASTYYQNAVTAIRKDLGDKLPKLPLGTTSKK